MTSQDTIIKAMGNTNFLDFVESHDKSGRLEKACAEFFTDYHGNDAAAQLTTINKHHLVSMWRFFVAYMTGFKPYDFQMDFAFDSGCRTPWETEGLKKLLAEQYELVISQLA